VISALILILSKCSAIGGRCIGAADGERDAAVDVHRADLPGAAIAIAVSSRHAPAPHRSALHLAHKLRLWRPRVAATPGHLLALRAM
jgi:hypothetical protein